MRDTSVAGTIHIVASGASRLLRSRIRLPVWAILLSVTAMIVVAGIPVTTTTAVDYQKTTTSLPLYRKVLAFVDRDVHMRALADGVTGPHRDPTARAMALLKWVHENIRPVPSGFPVIDDHPYHVVVRGYGTFDQAADLLATLAAYVDIPATFVFSRDEAGHILYGFALLHLDDDWRVFDAREGRALVDPAGALARLRDLRTDEALTRDLPTPREANGVPYPRLLATIDPVAGHLRPYDQMPIPRMMWEIRRMFGARPKLT